MAIYEVTLEDGSVYEIETEDSPQDKPSMLDKAWDVLGTPERMSREGLNMMAGAVPTAEPTGDVFRDVALNTPKVVAETLAEVAPNFVSRGSILTAGALRGAKAARSGINAFGRMVANQSEQITGALPGSMSGAFDDATLMFGKGKKAVGGMYEAAKKAGQPIRDGFREIADKKQLVEEGLKAAKEGSLNPTEALMMRQALDQVKRRVADEFYRNARGQFDSIAKQAFDVADEAFQRAIKAESLRNILPQNKLGGASAFKTGIVAMLNDDNAGVARRLLGLSMSPAAAGTAATALGLGFRRGIEPLINNPSLGFLAGSLGLGKKRKGSSD